MQDLGITDISATGDGCACGGAGCGGHAHGAQHGASHIDGGQSFEVAGMTCEHCVASVTEELSALGGVEAVAIDLHPGEASTVVVSATRALSTEEIRAAVEDAGYTLAH